MILLVWDTFGEDELRFYEFEDGSEGTELARQCNNSYVNESGTAEDTTVALDKLGVFLQGAKQLCRQADEVPFGPYSAIYVSGFIP